ncbi:hypothetical protein TRFO_01849 [Tritrichomonas foetus]|uniref:Uncharacterized protein n=1 Tax=Tritrichomonas foetus TaxID=1144522 RepID=A0A1J4JI38_9EUKA|nr:hypothetical protein TRFO_01849 [Tritrichomonas foetus]|eukprot:OHS98798.1 hypothetical protein TRFO_01849 [Tritrichomonas foetus]
MLTIPHTKEIKSNGKCDIQLLWERANSPASSPKPKKQSKSVEAINILALLSNNNNNKPAKKLFVPPTMQIKSEIKAKPETSLEFLVGSLIVTTNKEFHLPDSLDGKVTYVYKGAENQIESWNDFKKNVRTAKCSVASAARFAFIFEGGKVRAKAFTGTAQKQLEELSSDLTSIQLDSALQMIDEIQATQKLSLYSTDMFYYSVVHPITLKSTEFESTTGKKYRTVLSGYLFPFEVKEVHSMDTNYETFNLTSNILY